MSYYKQISADNQVKVGAGKIKGLFVSAASGSPGLAVYDTPDGDTSNDPKIIDTFVPVAATMYPLSGDDGGVFFTNGLYIDITNTVSVTVIYE